MGVHSFWDIVGPTARPVRLESLQDRRMAVDASIWIYQFLKAVRDQEGNAVKNSHVVGFFRRICKLLYFGIKPVFVFDGGVPALKRSTIQQRKEKRQGKRDNAAITARKLLAIQLQKKEAAEGQTVTNEADNNTSNYEVFKPQDEWHLPAIPGFRYDRDDRRVVSAETFERVVNSVDDELDNIDLDSINPASAEFEELPKSTQYLILSTLRLKSRLRMGYTKEQLEQLFPDSLDFSKFQIDMVKRRNFFTQKLMGVTGVHDGGASNIDDEVVKRVSGQINREYKLTKSENGWTLGLGDLDGSETKKAIFLDDQDKEAFDFLKNRKTALNKAACTSPGNEDNNIDEDIEECEWEDVDVKPQETKKREDYSIKAARLPQLRKETSSAGSQSFLDRRHDHVSPSKRSYPSTVRHVVENDDNPENDDEDEIEYEKQMEEIELMEAVQRQRSKNALVQQGLQSDLRSEPQVEGSQSATYSKQRSENEPISRPRLEASRVQQHYSESLGPKPRVDINYSVNNGNSDPSPMAIEHKFAKKPSDYKTDMPALTASEQNLKHIVSKVPDFNFGESNSFLFQESAPLSGETDQKEEEAEAKRPPPEAPIWFSNSNIQENPYVNSKFVSDNEMSTTRPQESSGEYKLVTGLTAQELLQEKKCSENGTEDLIVREQSVAEPVGDAENSDVDILSRQEADNERTQRKPLAFDYDFSEEEEDHIAENMRKEELEFATFKNTLSNKMVDNAFMEDELFEQQMKDKRDSDEVTPDMITEVQDLLSRFGIPHITAPMEAEAQCAELLNLKLVDGIITDDSDVFLFGGTKIYKNMFHEKNYVEYYDVQSIKQNLGLDRDGMIELAQLLGSDYTNGIKGMGPVSSMEVLAEFGSLDKFRDWYNEGQFDKKKQGMEKKFEKDLRKRLTKNEVVLNPEFPSELVREAYLRPEVDHDKSAFVWGTPDLDMLRLFMQARVGWPQEKSDEILIPLIRDINNRKKQTRQRTLNEFFPSEYIKENKKLNLGKRITTATGKLKQRRLK